MRDAGLEQAIKTAGGVASQACSIGVAQPSVSAWSRIPAERVLAVEALTRVQRCALHPDLCGPPEDQVSSKSDVDEIDQLRAAEYDLLSLLLGKAPDADTLSRVAALKGDASDLGVAHLELAAAALNLVMHLGPQPGSPQALGNIYRIVNFRAVDCQNVVARSDSRIGGGRIRRDVPGEYPAWSVPPGYAVVRGAEVAALLKIDNSEDNRG